MTVGMDDAVTLGVRALSVGYVTAGGGVKRVVEGVDFSLRPGRVLGLAGESGSGKSTAALAALGYVKPGVRVLGGQSLLDGETDLLTLRMADRRKLWGSQIAYVPQSAAMSLNPGTTVGKQLTQVLRQHTGLRREALRDRQIDLLTEMGLPDPARALERYPFQFSGGQQQRLSLAIALAGEPRVLLLDEPTTGLDVTTQARMTELLRGLVEQRELSALYISHNLALLGQVADDIAVMYAGEIVERSGMASFVTRPRHPYARALCDVTAGSEEGRLVPGIPGTPSGSVVLDACAFAPRCSSASDQCTTTHPPVVEVSSSHTVRCLRVGRIVVGRVHSFVRQPPKSPSPGKHIFPELLGG